MQNKDKRPTLLVQLLCMLHSSSISGIVLWLNIIWATMTGKSSSFWLLLSALIWHHIDAQSRDDTVALIVGGLASSEDVLDGTASVELFGCPGRSEDSYPVGDYPFPVYYSASIYYEDYALSCGGLACGQGNCDGPTNECFSWRPRGMAKISGNSTATFLIPSGSFPWWKHQTWILGIRILGRL